jgi:transposase InsO family protein
MLTPAAPDEPVLPTPAGDDLAPLPKADAPSDPPPASAPPIDLLEPTLARLRDRAGPAPPGPPAGRGSGHQQRQRDAEYLTRRRAAEAGRRLFDLGWAWARIADLFHVAGRTLRHWCHDLLDRFRPACPLGRPVVRSPRAARDEVIHFLDRFGPQAGVPTLRACFPAMSRAELADLLARYRRVWRERHREPLRVLTWPVAGRVWAIDYAEPPAPIDGGFGSLLAVRDLATGMPLAWRPVPSPTAANAAAVLAGLFAEHGAPLVVKSDNGSPFTGGAVPEVLRAHGVEHLLSPPYWPRYNGAIEAGIHALKDRTAAHAARAGRPGSWTWDDTAGALWEAAEWARPHGPTGPSPATEWRGRTAITATERDAFAACVRVEIACGGAGGGVQSEAEVARTAIRHALEERGYLQYQRRSILPPITGRAAASNP